MLLAENAATWIRGVVYNYGARFVVHGRPKIGFSFKLLEYLLFSSVIPSVAMSDALGFMGLREIFTFLTSGCAGQLAMTSSDRDRKTSFQCRRPRRAFYKQKSLVSVSECSHQVRRNTARTFPTRAMLRMIELHPATIVLGLQ